MEPRFEVIPKDGFPQSLHVFDWVSEEASFNDRQLKLSVPTKLNDGYLPRIQLPEPRRKCQIPSEPTPIRQKLMSAEKVPIAFNELFYLLFFQSPIETDEHAFTYLLENNISFTMDACTLRSLLVAPWDQRDQKFAIKFSVQQRYHEGSYPYLILNPL
jgi:hypothetical protein